MALSPGSRLGQYEIVAPLGAGGMGEVYRARDTTLGRDVALKFLSETFASDPDRLARFEREARTLAALNHPYIATIHGVEEGDGKRALVMEFVDGEDLSARISRGPIPLDEALPIARQIAEALEAAHEAGIIHRDLKPANIKVRADGTVKVLDFGLAKALDPSLPTAVSVANSPTLSVHATMQGVILGTAAYMAPEQAKGRAVDRRADIWAFGAVLFEILAGQAAFGGDSTTEILGAVVLKDPDWNALPASTPYRLRDLLRRCLQKDPRARQRDIGDVRLELIDLAASPREDVSARPAAPRTQRTMWLGAITLALAAASIGIVVGWRVPRTSADRPQAVARFMVPAPGKISSYPLLSPDGRFLVFLSDGRVYRRDLNEFESRPIAGTEGAGTLFMSTDGRWIGFFAGGKIKRVSSAGGDPLAIADASDSTPGAGWGPDNTVLFSPGWATPLFSVPTDGGQPTALTTLDTARGERAHWWPRLLPGGRQFLFTIWMAASGVNDARLAIFDVETRRHRVLFPGADGHYLASGHILYFHAGTWHVIPFDTASGTASGDPVTVLDDAIGVLPDGSLGQQLSPSLTGALAYLRGPFIPPSELMWAGRDGVLEPLRLPTRRFFDVALSPDGRRIVTARVEGGAFELWLYEIERKTEDRFAVKGSNFNPIWDATGETLAFVSERKGEYDTYAMTIGGGEARGLFTRDFDEAPRAWTRDGRHMLIQEWHPDGSTPLALVELGNAEDRKVLRSVTNATDNVSLSRDGRWMLYDTVSGSSEVYVQRFPEQSPPVRISSRGGGQAFWSPTSSEIFYRREEEVVSVRYREEGGRFVVADETVLFRLAHASFGLYGVTPDGRRFLIRRSIEPPPAPGIRVVLNWLEELKQRVPTR